MTNPRKSGLRPHQLAVAVFVSAMAVSSSAQDFGINGVAQSLFSPHGSIFDSTLDVIDDFPASYTVSEAQMTGDDDTGFFSNSHKFYFSSDGGSSAREFAENEAFDIQFDLTIETPNPTPRKSAGFNLDSIDFGTAQYVASTNNSLLPHGDPPGPVAAFGAPFSFHSFGEIYNAGETINLRLIYLPPTRSVTTGDFIETGVIEYVLTNSGGAMSSGLLDINENPDNPDDSPGIPDGSRIGFRTQSSARSSTVDDSVDFRFNNFVITELAANGGGDFDASDAWDLVDVDMLVAEIVAETNTETFDLTFDGIVDQSDLDQWLVNAGYRNNQSRMPYLYGDANLDGVVDVSDFNIWNSNKFTSAPAWSQGDFTADGSIDVSDFNSWNSNKFNASDSSAQAVPEPANLLHFLALLPICFWHVNRVRKR